MKSKNVFIVLSIIIFHVCLGFLFQDRTFSKIFNISIFVIAVISILRNYNNNNEAVMWSAYIVGSEVLFRMTKGLFFYELSKYMVFIFLITGLYIEKRKHGVSPIFLIYILLLLVGIAFSEIPFPSSIRTNVIFNLSGPILLGVCALYFYKRKFTIDKLLNVLFWLTLPIISMVSYLYFKTPDIRDIVFGGGANLAASGGYGPNQVSTILGVGVFAFVAHLMLGKRVTSLLVMDSLLLVYIFYRNLITFSRGGLITAIVAVLIFGFFIILSRKNYVFSFLKYFTISLLLILSVFLYTLDATDGMLENRYTNKNARGIEKKDVTTGRLMLLSSELTAFYENPIFGIGVGTGKFKRMEDLGIKAASHNEISRLLGEHGLIGLILLIILLTIPIINSWNQPLYSKAFVGAFFIFWFLTISHSAMRISFPSFIYGLSLINLRLRE